MTDSLEESLVGTYGSGAFLSDVSTTYTFRSDGRYDYVLDDEYGAGVFIQKGEWSASGETLELDVRAYGSHGSSMRDTSNWVIRRHLMHGNDFEYIVLDHGEKLYRGGKAPLF